MDSSRVTVLDARGRVLSRGDKDSSSIMTSDLIDLKKKVELDMEKQIEDILQKAVGVGVLLLV